MKRGYRKAIADLKAVKDNQDATAEELKKATDEVMTKFQKVSQEMYQKQLKNNKQHKVQNKHKTMDLKMTM